MSSGLGEAPAAGELPTATVFDFVGGKVASIRVFLDRAQGLEAVGLAELSPQGGGSGQSDPAPSSATKAMKRP